MPFSLSFPNPSPPSNSFSRTRGLVSSSTSSFREAELSSKLDDDDFSKPVLKYIDQVLMEESSEERLSLSHDLFALRATEKSLHDVIATDITLNSSSAVRNNSNSLVSHGNYRPLFPNTSERSGSWPSSGSSLISFAKRADGDVVGTSADEFTIQYPSNSHESGLHFWRDPDDDAHKFLSQSIKLIVATEQRSWLEKFNVVVNRNAVTLCYEDGNMLPHLPGDDRGLEPVGQFRGSRVCAKKQDKKKEHAVDLRNLLILCAEAVSGNEYRTANQLLAQIRQYSSPMGDGVQRLAHYFAKGLEARFSARVVQQPDPYIKSMKVPINDLLRFYQTIFLAHPFCKIAISFVNNLIAKVAEKAKTLRVVDFGIMYGFQWPQLIQLLSRRPGGRPKLRITGIEKPQLGFRPLERIEETGTHLVKYCKRLGVPFEYQGIVSHNWETIKINELKLNRNEVLAVNCLFRFKNLLDGTIAENNPRDAVLQLIQEMKPDVFVQSIVNGSYNSPFFMTRFKETLYHLSALFDMMDVNVPRDSPERMFIEEGYYIRRAINVISCEGTERFERPETYKQWQNRVAKAGFRQVPLGSS
ncbi:hypothetical protein CDL15_Pgr024981 [Punica granatum]|uniref:Uncharacterized protein n=2 Tax=Punica granatum TaxID=22663 RepID=A0A218W7F4_PUNGR|nr:hypothetical protein CDL15_Pgr024981 [Punica granatum]